MFLQLVTAYPFIWVTGIAIAFWPMLFLMLVGTLRSLQPSIISNALLFVGIFELISIPIGILNFQVGLDRVLSAVVNSLIWITSSFLISYSYSKSQLLRLSRALINIGLIQGAIVIFAQITFPRFLPFPFLHASMEALGSNSAAFSSNEIVYQDWLNGSTLRTHGIMANATWAGGFSALALILLAASQQPSIGVILRNLYKYFLLVYVIYLSLSRSVFLALLLSTLVGVLFKLTSGIKTELQIAFIQICSILIITFAWITFQTGELSQTVNSINQSRSGSLETRSDIYRVTVQLVAEHPFPAIGYGIKPVDEGLVASVATHSTPLGVLFKGGIFATIAYFCFLMFGLKKLIETNNYLGLVMFNFIILWSFLEDFDGGHLIPLFLSLIFQPGLLRNLRNNFA